MVLKFSKQIKEYRKTTKLRKMNKYDIRELHFETLVLIGTVIVETKRKHGLLSNPQYTFFKVGKNIAVQKNLRAKDNFLKK